MCDRRTPVIARKEQWQSGNPNTRHCYIPGTPAQRSRVELDRSLRSRPKATQTRRPPPPQGNVNDRISELRLSVGRERAHAPSSVLDEVRQRGHCLGTRPRRTAASEPRHSVGSSSLEDTDVSQGRGRARMQVNGQKREDTGGEPSSPTAVAVIVTMIINI